MEYYLTTVSETSVFMGSLPIARRLISSPGANNVTFVVTLTVIDALGATATSQTEMFIEVDRTAVWTSDASLTNSAVLLANAANLADWDTGRGLIVELVDALLDRMEIESSGTLPVGVNLTISQQTDSLVIASLVKSSVALAQTLPVTTSTTAAVLYQFEFILSLSTYTNFSASELNQIASLLNYFAMVESNVFGGASSDAYGSLESILTLQGLLGKLSNGSNNGLNIQGGIGACYQALLDQPSSDPALTFPVSGLLAQIQTVPINTSQVVDIAHPGYSASVTFDPTQFDSTTVPSGLVGYHYIQYDKSFPNLPSNAAVDVVSVMTIIAQSSTSLSKRSALASLVSASALVVTNFTSVNTSTPTPINCATYDSSTSTWSTSSCATSTASSSVSCSCSGVSGSPLTLLFGSAPSSPGSPVSPIDVKYGGLSLGAIIGIAVGGAAALLIVGAIILVLSVPKLRRIVQPYYGTSTRETM